MKTQIYFAVGIAAALAFAPPCSSQAKLPKIDWNTQIKNKPTIPALPIDWDTQIKNKPFIPAAAPAYNFAALTPGGSITVGANTITLTPCPLGVAGTDLAHLLWISAGTGTPEAVLITGGTCTSGGTSGTVTFTAANAHTGAWTVSSASGGIGEAVCAQGSSGKPIVVSAPATLNANVASCVAGVTAIFTVYPGATLTGTGSLLGTVVWSKAEPANFGAFPTPWDIQKINVNNFPASSEFGPTVPVLSGVVGAVKMKTNGPYQVQGLAGYAMTGGDDQAAVGAYASGLIGVQPTVGHSASAFGLNVNTENCIGGVACADGAGFSGTNNYGIEVDVTAMKDAAGVSGANFIGLYFSGASSHQPAGYADAVQVDHMGAFTTPKIAWKNAFVSKNGAANVGLALGTTTDAGASNSQPIALHSRTAGGVDNQASIFEDATGNLYVVAGGGQVILADAGLNIAASVTPAGTAPVFKIFAAAVIGAAQCVVTSGTGSPNAVVVGSPCDMYLNKAGGAGTTMWVKESGVGTTSGWTGK